MWSSDDGFGCSDTARRNITDVLQRWSNMRKSRRKRKCSTSASAGGFETPQFGGNHDMDASYSTDELQSDVDCEGEEVHKYPMFKADDVGRDFKFCLGMEFCSLKEFKQALKEYSVLNGREVIFLKNDDVRVRAICKKKCGFLILCSKVGGSHTFQVETLVDSHSCGRVFANRNANKDWVSKVVADKYRNVGKMTANEIIYDIKKTYSVRISRWKAMKGKQIAMDIVEGDREKQYSLLYDYVAELKRVSAGTTCKIKINHPLPTLQPRFGSFYMCLEGCQKGFINGRVEEGQPCCI